MSTEVKSMFFADEAGHGDGDIQYETVGILNGGHIVWLLAKIPSNDVVGSYLLFSDSHNLKGELL